jgi:hypothetical protein
MIIDGDLYPLDGVAPVRSPATGVKSPDKVDHG